MNKELLSFIKEKCEEDTSLLGLNVPGNCRQWTDRAMDLMEVVVGGIGIECKVDAREVVLEPGLEHSFVRIVIEGEEPILWDGVGTIFRPGYFGYESNAPDYLRDSRDDLMINNYRKIRRSGKL